MAGMLDGVKVVSMGLVVAIPAASAMLADWGADVVKLEPLTGEIHRGLRRAQGVDIGDIHWVIQVLNRNKKGLAIDLKKPQGIEIIHKLIRKTDVFMYNYELSSLKKLKLDYATLSKINPRLIHAVINGYGSEGPDKDERGYDFAAGWARSGMMHLIGEPGSPLAPQRAGMIDSLAGAHLAAGISAALFNREKTGKGQEIEVSLYQAAVWSLALDVQGSLVGVTPVKHDRTKAGNPLFNSYRTKDDRWFWLAMLQADVSWHDFCMAMERPEVENDPRFSTREARTENCEELIRLIDTVLGSRTRDEWEKRFREHNVIYGRVQTTDEVVKDPQALANEFFVDLPNLPAKMKTIATPVKFRQNPASVRNPAPEIGQHTEETLLDLGYSWEDIAGLKEQGVIL